MLHALQPSNYGAADAVQLVILLLVILIIMGLFVRAANGDSTVLLCKILAVTVSTLVLAVKLMGVLVHTDNIKQMTVKATSY